MNFLKFILLHPIETYFLTIIHFKNSFIFLKKPFLNPYLFVVVCISRSFLYRKGSFAFGNSGSTCGVNALSM